MFNSYFWRMSPFKRLVFLKFFAGGGASGIWKTVSGAIVHITDALAKPLLKCEVTLEPIQDLHGQDAPYPAGGGVNICEEEWELGGIVYATGETYPASDRLRNKNYCSCEPNTSYYAKNVTNSGHIFWYASDKTYISYEAAVNTALTSPSNAYYFKIVLGATTTYDHSFSLNYPSTDTSYHPYSNICPITGHTGCEAVRTGKNMLPVDNVSGTKANVVYGNSNGLITANGTKNGGGYADFTSNKVFLKAGTYTAKTKVKEGSVTRNGSDNSFTAYLVSTEGTSNIGDVTKAGSSKNITITKDMELYLRFAVWNDGVFFDNAVIEVSLFYGGDSTSDFEPYSGTTISITFPALGSNQWDEETVGGILNSDGTVSDSSARLVTKNYVPIKGGETYCVTIPYANRGRGAFYDANKTLISYFVDFPVSGNPDVFPNDGALYQNGSTYYFTFIAPSNACYVKYNVVPTYGTTYNNDIAINYPSTKTTYEPYTSTVFGAEVDVTGGKLRVDMASVDLGNLPFSYQSATDSFIVYGSQFSPSRKNGGNLLCSIYPVNDTASANTQSILSGETKKIYWQSSNSYLYIKDSTYGTDANAFKAAVSGQQLVYELATPIEYDLTPQQIIALRGENNIWADNPNSEVEVTYKASAS